MKTGGLPGWAPLLVLGLIVLVTTAILAAVGLDNHFVLNDEANSILLGRAVAEDPISILTVSTGRGVERAVPLIVALTSPLAKSAAGDVQVLRISFALVQGMVAIPVYAAARELDLSRWQALVPAVIGSTGSFAFFGLFALNGSVGVLAFSFLVWTVLFASRPRSGIARVLLADSLVILAVVLVAVSRVGWVPLAIGVLPALCAGAWFNSGVTGAGSLAKRLRAFPLELAKSHPLLILAAVLGAVAIVRLGTLTVTGGYGNGSTFVDPSGIGAGIAETNAQAVIAHLAIGVAFVPLVIAIPAILRNLVVPPIAADGALAWLTVFALVAFAVVYLNWSSVSGGAVIEDRYSALIVPIVALVASAAVFRRPALPVWAVVTSAVLVGWLLASGFRAPDSDPFGFFVAPSTKFFDTAFLGRLVETLPASKEFFALAVAVGAGLCAVSIFVFLRSGRPAGRVVTALGSLLLAGIVSFQLFAMEYPSRKFVAAAGFPQTPSEEVSFVDRAGRGAPARALSVGVVQQPLLASYISIVSVFNTSVKGSWLVGTGAEGVPLDATVDPDTGAVSTVAPPPDLLVASDEFTQIRMEGRELRGSTGLPFLRVTRLAQPLRARWVVSGSSTDGLVAPGQEATVRVFPTGSPDRCLRMVLSTDPGAQAPVQFEVSFRPTRRAGALGPGRSTSIDVPLAAANNTDVALTTPPTASSFIRVASLQVRRCG